MICSTTQFCGTQPWRQAEGGYFGTWRGLASTTGSLGRINIDDSAQRDNAFELGMTATGTFAMNESKLRPAAGEGIQIWGGVACHSLRSKTTLHNNTKYRREYRACNNQSRKRERGTKKLLTRSPFAIRPLPSSRLLSLIDLHPVATCASPLVALLWGLAGR